MNKWKVEEETQGLIDGIQMDHNMHHNALETVAQMARHHMKAEVGMVDYINNILIGDLKDRIIVL
jgi:hypothetical protein